MNRNIDVGRDGEALAADYLVAQGMHILDRNWRTAAGEIDIVARDGDALVVIEVKTRTGPIGGHPFEAITVRKRARLRMLARAWSAANTRVDGSRLRIDAVAVTGTGADRTIEHLRGVA